MRRLAALVLAALPWAAGAAAPESFAYGPELAQTLDLYRADVQGPAPLILFVHGGGWRSGFKAMGARAQPGHFVARGYAWATMEYRLIPYATVEQQAADVARAFAWLRSRAERFGVDPHRIVLMGHSAGGHLVALVASDPQWLLAEGLSPDMIRAVVTLDAAGLDIVTAMAPGGGASSYHLGAFGPDVARQTRLSPSSHAAAPNAPHWQMLFDVDNNPAGGRFAETLGEGLRAAGADARIEAVMRTTHMRMLYELGVKGDPATGLVDDFLAEVLARPGSVDGR